MVLRRCAAISSYVALRGSFLDVSFRQLDPHLKGDGTVMHNNGFR